MAKWLLLVSFPIESSPPEADKYSALRVENPERIGKWIEWLEKLLITIDK